MALYLGNIKIAGDGDEGTAIISCDSYEDYQQKLNSGDYPPGTAYATPNEGEISEQLQSDWTQTDTTKVDYIKNKPTIGNGTLSITVGSTATTFTANSTENKSITIPAVSVVATLPSSPNTNTLYFVTNSN